MLFQFIYDAISTRLSFLTKIQESSRNQYLVRLQNFVATYNNIDDFLVFCEEVYKQTYQQAKEWYTVRGQLHVLRLIVRAHYNELDPKVRDNIIDLAEDFDLATHNARNEHRSTLQVVDKEYFRKLADEAYKENKITLRMYCIILIYSEVPLRDDLQVTWQQSVEDSTGKSNYLSSSGDIVVLHIVKGKTIPRVYNARSYNLSPFTSMNILQYVKTLDIDTGSYVFGRNKLSNDIVDILTRMGISTNQGGINYIRRMHRTNAVASGNRAFIAAVRKASAHSALSAQGYTSQLKRSAPEEHVQWGESSYSRIQHKRSRGEQRPIHFS